MNAEVKLKKQIVQNKIDEAIKNMNLDVFLFCGSNMAKNSF